MNIHDRTKSTNEFCILQHKNLLLMGNDERPFKLHP